MKPDRPPDGLHTVPFDLVFCSPFFVVFEGPYKTHAIISESRLEKTQTDWCLSYYEDREQN